MKAASKTVFPVLYCILLSNGSVSLVKTVELCRSEPQNPGSELARPGAAQAARTVIAFTAGLNSWLDTVKEAGLSCPLRSSSLSGGQVEIIYSCSDHRGL